MHTNKLNSDTIRTLYWDRNYSVEEISKELDVSFWSLYAFMHRNNIPRRNPSETNYLINKDKPKFEAKENLNALEQKLKIAGIMLYWAEGTLRGNTVDLANSNPQMVAIFLRFLREVCGIKEDRLRVYLYAYSYQDIDALKLYWHKITKIPLSQFTKPYIRQGNKNLSGRKLLYGLVHIRYNDKRLLNHIENWINECIDWAGTQAAKGDRLCKRSAMQ